MKAWLIEYEFSVEDWDPCKGHRTLNYSQEALLLNDGVRRAIVVYSQGNGFIFPVSIEIDDTLNYGALDFYIPLPRKVSDYKIVRVVDIEDALAKDIIEIAHLIDKFYETRRKATSFLLGLRDKK